MSGNRNCKRHHASKEFKKINSIDEKAEADHEVMFELAKRWWNSWKEDYYLRYITEIFMRIPSNDIEAQEKFLKKEFYYLANNKHKFFDMISIRTFVEMFKYNIPNFFVHWLKETDRRRKIQVKGALEIEILEVYGKRKKVKFTDFFNKLGIGNHATKDGYLESELRSVLTGMVKKNFISEPIISEYGEKYYEIYAINDKDGWFLDKNESIYDIKNAEYNAYKSTRLK